MLRHLDLFSGIGGFALAARMVGGYETHAFCEIDPYCRAVLRKHWPTVPIYDDVREMWGPIVCETWHESIDIITGGFPCQDISLAGPGAGIDGERSGLWAEYARLICELRPRFVLVENVSALLGRGLERVLGDLAALGYDALWHCVPASYVGAPHSRDRIWIIAYPQRAGFSADLLESFRAACEGIERAREFWGAGWLHELAGQHGRWLDAAPEARVAAAAWLHAPCEPLLLGVADGVSRRVDRLHALGNAIVPQVAAIFLQAIRDVIDNSNQSHACGETR